MWTVITENHMQFSECAFTPFPVNRINVVSLRFSLPYFLLLLSYLLLKHGAFWVHFCCGKNIEDTSLL